MRSSAPGTASATQHDSSFEPQPLALPAALRAQLWSRTPEGATSATGVVSSLASGIVSIVDGGRSLPQAEPNAMPAMNARSIEERR